MISDDFAPLFLETVNDLRANPVHLLFNQWWSHASPDAVEAYRQQLLDDPNFASWVEAGHFAEPVDLDAMASLEAGTLGRVYRDWIIDNGLAAQIAMDYRTFHQMLADSGQLDGMPGELQYSVLRGFQVHDFQHVLTGYDSSPKGEIALQAFGLAQVPFPYQAMWMSVVTTRMAFVDPNSIVPMMDAISDGWQYGRRTPDLRMQRWEELLDQPLDALRHRFSIELSPLAARQEARRIERSEVAASS